MPMTRLRQAALLLSPVARTLPWGALPVILVFASGLVELERRQPGLDLWALRGSALMLAVWAGFAFDDPAEATVEPAPFPLLARRALRVLLPVAALVVCWTMLLARTLDALPVGGVTLEAAALVAVAFAGAAAASRLTADHLGGLVAGPVVLGLLLGATRLPKRLWLLAPPGDPGWAAAHHRWAVIFAIAVAVLLVASLDPGRRGPKAAALLAGHRSADRHRPRHVAVQGPPSAAAPGHVPQPTDEWVARPLRGHRHGKRITSR